MSQTNHHSNASGRRGKADGQPVARTRAAFCCQARRCHRALLRCQHRHAAYRAAKRYRCRPAWRGSPLRRTRARDGAFTGTLAKDHAHADGACAAGRDGDSWWIGYMQGHRPSNERAVHAALRLQPRPLIQPSWPPQQQQCGPSRPILLGFAFAPLAAW
jgi:hypothetical protein